MYIYLKETLKGYRIKQIISLYSNPCITYALSDLFICFIVNTGPLEIYASAYNISESTKQQQQHIYKICLTAVSRQNEH